MSFFLNLGDIGTFFSDELSALENFANWISSDFINFINSITSDIQNITSFLSQAFSDIQTFMQNIANDFLNILQNFVQTASSAISGFISWFGQQVTGFFSTLASLASGFLSDVYNFFTDVADAFAQILSTAVSDFLSGFGQNMRHISSAISQIIQFLTPFIAPITVAKFLPAITDKIAEILPDVEISLAPVGLGGKIPIKFGEIVKAFAESTVDFLNEVRGEAQSTLKEFIKEPFVSDFKISVREIFNEVGLGDLPFADPPFHLIANWVSVRSFDEIKDHLKETILLTGYAQWFTDAYLQPPVDDYVPKNPLFKPVNIKDVILASQYGILDFSSVSQYAYNNLITPKTAKLKYQNQTAKLLQKAVEEGIRQFVVTPEKAYQEIINNVNLSGQQLFEKVFTLEYEYAVQRIVRQFLRSLLSRALTNFGRPYLDLKFLESTVQDLFKKLNYPKNVQDVFDIMITQSQLIYSNELILEQLKEITRLGVYDEKRIKEILQAHKFNEQIALEILNYELQYVQLQYMLRLYEQKLKAFIISSADAEKELKALGFNSAIVSEIVEEYQHIPFVEYQIRQIEEMAKKGYINPDELKKQLHPLQITKEFEEAFVNYTNQEIQISATLSIIREQLRNFIIDEKSAENELKKMKINDYLISQIMKEDYEISLTKLQLSYFESLAKNLYLDQKQLESELAKILKNKSAVDLYVQKFYFDYIFPKIVNYHVELAKHGVTTDIKSLPKEIVDYEIQPAILEYQINLELEYIKSQFRNLQITTDEAIKELEKLGIDKSLINTIVQTYYSDYVFPKIINYYTTLARHGVISDISKLPKDIVEYEIKPALLEYQVELEIEYIKSLLKDLQIKPDEAIKELEKLGIEKNLANLIVQTYTPTLYNIHTIIANIIEGQLYKVGKVPVNLGNAEAELRKLGIPENQIKILLDQYASSFGLEVWRRYLPSLEEIEKALKYNYPISKLVELSYIPSEFLNLYTDVYQHELIGVYVHTLKDEYIQTLIYGIQNSQLENLLRQYGINEVFLGVLKLSAQIKKLILGFEEVYLTPSKALSISEYVSNPNQLLQKVFSEFSIPADLQNTYLEYARNKRVRTYVQQIIETINLLFERHKINLDTAQQYLNQLKKYGLTDEEIQLILLNWQLREKY